MVGTTVPGPLVFVTSATPPRFTGEPKKGLPASPANFTLPVAGAALHLYILFPKYETIFPVVEALS